MWTIPLSWIFTFLRILIASISTASFDAIVETLKNEPVATPCVFSCQVSPFWTLCYIINFQLSTLTMCSDGEGSDHCGCCHRLPHQRDPDHQRAQVSNLILVLNNIVLFVRKMEELKLISTETLRDLIYEKFERMPDYPKTAEEEDPLAKVC